MYFSYKRFFSKDVPKNEVGDVELVTAPRFFGIAFNPLNTYYVYRRGAKAKSLLAVLLEVNNTFGERHIYLCDARNELNNSLPGYHAAFSLKRAFHVSPFNNRTGIYEANIMNPAIANKMGVLLVIKSYHESVVVQPNIADIDDSNKTQPKKHLTAGVSGSAVPLNIASLTYLFFVYPGSLLLTSLRIMFEAYKLAYHKKLPVYQRPNPYRSGSSEGMTIVRKKPDNFQR